jgi:hypothetical protein
MPELYIYRVSLSIIFFIAQHLQVPEASGLVRTCSIASAGLAVLEQWIRDRRSPWERKLDRLGELLAEPET